MPNAVPALRCAGKTEQQAQVMRRLLDKTTPTMMKWIVQIILKSLRVREAAWRGGVTVGEGAGSGAGGVAGAHALLQAGCVCVCVCVAGALVAQAEALL